MGHLHPQTLPGSSRREHTGKRRKPETQQVAALFSALHSTTDFLFQPQTPRPRAQGQAPYPDHLARAGDEGFADAQLRGIEVEFPRVCLHDAWAPSQGAPGSRAGYTHKP